MMNKIIKFKPTSIINSENNSYLSIFFPESSIFRYSKHFTKKKEISKLCTRVVNLYYNYSKTEYYTTVYNGIKTYFTVNLELERPPMSFKQKCPLTNTSLIKNKYRDVFLYNKDFTFTNPQFHTYRNLRLKMYPLRESFIVISNAQSTRLLNKLIFYNLFNSVNKNFIHLNKIISRHDISSYYIYKKHYLKFCYIFYVGFKLFCHTNKKKILINLPCIKRNYFDINYIKRSVSLSKLIGLTNFSKFFKTSHFNMDRFQLLIEKMRISHKRNKYHQSRKPNNRYRYNYKPNNRYKYKYKPNNRYKYKYKPNNRYRYNYKHQFPKGNNGYKFKYKLKYKKKPVIKKSIYKNNKKRRFLKSSSYLPRHFNNKSLKYRYIKNLIKTMRRKLKKQNEN